MSRDGLGDYKIVQVIKGIKYEMTPFLLILAQTIQGLDDCRTEKYSSFTGSPLLLQIWLQEKLSLLEKPAGNWMKYELRKHQERHIKDINGNSVYISVK